MNACDVLDRELRRVHRRLRDCKMLDTFGIYAAQLERLHDRLIELTREKQ